MSHCPEPEAAGAQPVTFLRAARPLPMSALRGFARIYGPVHRRLARSSAFAWLARDHLLFFVLASAGFLLLVPRFLIHGRYAVEQRLLHLAVERPDLAGWPYVSGIVIPFIGAALLTFRLTPSARLTALAVVAAVLAFAFGLADVPGVALFALFVFCVHRIVRLPTSRLTAAVVLGTLSIVLMVVTAWWMPWSPLAAVAAFQTALIPMLWYSAYEHRPPRSIPLRRLVPYLSARFFSTPVLTYRDLFGQVSPDRLAEVRFGGIKALYVAAVASIAAAIAELVEARFPLEGLSGLPLLSVAYVGYVGAYCQIVVPFNSAIGVLRLFGIPIRDNFDYWLLARTPNEHWQRWNILFREWVITFVFYPIMRQRRWLFVATMAALLTSGALHLLPGVVVYLGSSFAYTAEVAYWVINGLAIYSVLKVQQLFPKAVSAAGFGRSAAWGIAGVISTSAFYAILYGMRVAGNWSGVGRFLRRLVELD